MFLFHIHFISLYILKINYKYYKVYTKIELVDIDY